MTDNKEKMPRIEKLIRLIRVIYIIVGFLLVTYGFYVLANTEVLHLASRKSGALYNFLFAASVSVVGLYMILRGARLNE